MLVCLRDGESVRLASAQKVSEADALPAEHEHARVLVLRVPVGSIGTRAEEVHLAETGRFELGEVIPPANSHVLPVIEPSAPHALVVELEAELADEVQFRVERERRAPDIARVPGDLGLDEDEVEASGRG